MADARRKEAWDRTSTVLALIANVNRDPKRTRAVRPDQFNPYRTKRTTSGIPITRDNIRVLKSLVKKKGKSSNGEARNSKQ